MRLPILLVALLAFPGHAQVQDDPYIPFSLPLFKDGLYTRYSANAIPEGGLSQALNVLIDEDVDGVVVARNGYSKYNPTAITNTLSVRGLWPFDASDGTKYLVAFTSSSFYKSSGDGAWTAITGLDSFSRTADFDCVQAIGKLFCANGTVVISWNGTSTAAVAGAPIGNLVGKFRNRLLLSGIAGSKGRLRGSGELDETDWTVQVPGVSTTPFNIAFGGADDGEDITCLMGSYQDVFLVGKRNSLWGLYGFGRTDFEVREISREVGCIEQRSVKEKNNCLYWLSTRGVERFCGASIGRASDPIRDQIDTVVATAGNARSNTDTTQTDFEAGNLTVAGLGAPLSATISPGNVVGSTATQTDTTSADFAAGTLVHFSTTAVANQITAVQGSSATFINAGGESNNATTNWTMSGPNAWQVVSNTANWGSKAFGPPCAGGTITVDVAILDGATNDPIKTVSHSVVSGQAWTEYGIDTSTLAVTNVKVKFTHNCGSGGTGISNSFIRGSSFTYALADGDNAGVYAYFDVPEGHLFGFEFTSQTFDLDYSTPIFGMFQTNMSTNTNSRVSFSVKSSTDSDDTFSSLVYQPIEAKIAAGSGRYVIYYASGSISCTTCTASSIQDVTLTAGTTGQFISQCRNPGTGITAWGQIACTVSSFDGSWAIAVATGTSCSMATRSTATWTTQANNSIISVATASFVAYRLTNSYSLFVPTGNPTNQDCTINWSEGATRPPVASQVYRDRYYLAYTTSTLTTAANDHIFVLDKNDKWTLFSNHNCYSMALYNRKLYCGSSTAAGQVWQLDNGDDDDGTAINSRMKTKAFNLGLPERPKKFRSLYLDLEPSPDASQTIALVGSYFLERSTTSYALGSVDLNEDPNSILTAKFPFSLSNPVSGRYIQIQLESTGLNSPWRLFGGRLYYLPMEPE